jgi:hypothetical protein
MIMSRNDLKNLLLQCVTPLCTKTVKVPLHLFYARAMEKSQSNSAKLLASFLLSDLADTNSSV